jgi:hypothetical protein
MEEFRVGVGPGLWLWLCLWLFGSGINRGRGGLKNGDAKLCSGERENGKWDR